MNLNPNCRIWDIFTFVKIDYNLWFYYWACFNLLFCVRRTFDILSVFWQISCDITSFLSMLITNHSWRFLQNVSEKKKKEQINRGIQKPLKNLESEKCWNVSDAFTEFREHCPQLFDMNGRPYFIIMLH